MAEGLLRRLDQETIEVHSAGTHPSTINPLAIEAMREIGIDISGHGSKSVAEFEGCQFDTVITVCDHAAEHCPVFPGAPQRIHWSLPDPAGVIGTHQERLAAFRNVRDDLQHRLLGFLQTYGV
jgi:arsenate reductase (thioredoxin)